MRERRGEEGNCYCSEMNAVCNLLSFVNPKSVRNKYCSEVNSCLSPSSPRTVSRAQTCVLGSKTWVGNDVN